jgi:hypothetical protein
MSIKRFREFLSENGVAVNNVGGGAVGGLGISNPNLPNQATPPVKRKRRYWLDVVRRQAGRKYPPRNNRASKILQYAKEGLKYQRLKEEHKKATIICEMMDKLCFRCVGSGCCLLGSPIFLTKH